MSWSLHAHGLQPVRIVLLTVSVALVSDKTAVTGFKLYFVLDRVGPMGHCLFQALSVDACVWRTSNLFTAIASLRYRTRVPPCCW